MMKKSAGNELDRANLSHAVSTLGAAFRSLDRVAGYEAIATEIGRHLEELTKDLIIIRERERNGRETE
jgi:hypothetical protein